MNLRYCRPQYGTGARAGMTNSFLRGPSRLTEPFSAEWQDIFAPEENWERTVGEKVLTLGVSLMLGAEVPQGMEDDGIMSFTLHRPVGGHGSTFIDVSVVECGCFFTFFYYRFEI